MNVRQQQITVETLRPIVEPALGSLTKDQWLRLQSNEPNHSTMTVFAILILDIISKISMEISKTMQQSMSEADVEETIGTSVFDSIAEVVGVQNKEPFSPAFQQMIVKEVHNTLSLSHPNGVQHSVPIIPCTTLPHDLDKMASTVAEILKSFAAERKLVPVPPRRENISVERMSETCVQAVIRQEVNNLTDFLLVNDYDLDYGMIAAEADEDIKMATKGFSWPMAMPTDVQKVSLKKCFVKRLAKVSIYHILAQLRTIYPNDTNMQSRMKLEAFMASLDSLLEHGQNEKFRINVCHLIYNHLTSNHPEEASACALHCHLYSDVWSRVTSMQALMRWWVTTQSYYHISCVWDNVHLAKQDDVKRAAIWSIVTYFLMMLVRSTDEQADLENTRVAYYKQYEAIAQHLVYRTWTELKDKEIHVPQTSSEYYILTKVLFKVLSRRWGSLAQIFVGVTLNNEKFGILFASLLKKKIAKKTNFFSSFCNFWYPSF